MTEEAVCDHYMETHTGIGYLCRLSPGHPGLHRWEWDPSDGGDPERSRVWTDEGIDFLEGPYAPHEQPDGITCNDIFADSDTEIGCVRPKGHLGQHGNYHDEDSPAMWTGYEALPAALATWSAEPPVEGDIIHADFEVVIANGIAMPKELRLNGLKLPNVRELTVEYAKDEARIVIVEILATSLVEVPE